MFYQIYPRSYQDSNWDGIGDLAGITARLDYVRDLGVDAIWLSPTFPSPMRDFGYDVSDYLGVAPEFGSPETMETLIASCHDRGLRILLDFVPNHSSDQHPWFLESRASRVNPKRDWYVWRDARPDGSPPNNWRAVFGGPAWTFDTHTGQYFLHSFLPEQPDLDWRNPAVEAAMHEVVRTWFRRGIDGFRIDVMHGLMKHPDFADNPPNTAWRDGDRDFNRLVPVNMFNYPDVYGAVRRLRRVADEFEGRVLVGEVSGNASQIAGYYGGDALDGLHLAFNFHFIGRDGAHTPWDAGVMAEIIRRTEAAMPAGAQPCWAFGNHDRSRFVSRHDADGLGQARARAAALLLLGLRGTPFVYYGDEIGMRDVDVPEGERKDPSRFLWEARDPERTPMQWDALPGRGFSPAKPWLPYGPAHINVAAQAGRPGSLLELYRQALRIRRTTPGLSAGMTEDVTARGGVLSFVRAAERSRVYVAVNTTVEERPLPATGRLLVATGRSGNALEPMGAAWVLLSE